MMEDGKAVMIGENVMATLVGNALHIVVDLAAPGRLSASGKNLLVATTGKAATIKGHQVNLNVYRRPA